MVWGAIIGAVVTGVSNYMSAKKAEKAAAANQKGLLAPPEPPKLAEKGMYELDKFSPKNFNGSGSKTPIAGETPSLKSADPVMTEHLFWRRIMQDAAAQGEMRRSLGNVPR